MTTGGDEKLGGLPKVEGDVFAAAANNAFPKRRRRQQADSEPPAAEASREEPAPAPDPKEVPEQRAEAVPEPESGVSAAGPKGEAVAEKPAVSEPPASAVSAGELVVRTRPAPEPAAPRGTAVVVEIPQLGGNGSLPTQCTINVSTNVRERLAHYQLLKKMETGSEPTNAIVIRRAVLAARKSDSFGRLAHQVISRQQEPLDGEEDLDADGFLGEAIGRRAERGRIKDSQQQSFRPTRQELATYDAISAAYGFPSRSDFLNEVLDDFLPGLNANARGGRRR